ncbi:hypothetical protein UA08_06107 [Talaromyces atroroseus]|uniref:Signal peptidase complex subunit 2 n=1 Tax=Talaromyces atroroseus TaxID=1441469 RepID=A0A225AC44_TALAT|nr:hypothetical protein UA08_06107 [Talaromyces atroroseus]OKL58681.1 hypothetical protein UA08_06107 [Talaromyces atroroseus]
MTSTEAPKVPVYSLNDLKSTSDDALTPYLCTLPQPYTFKRDYTKTNIRFVVGYSAVLIAGVTFYLDRQLGWEATEALWVKVAVAAYFVLNTFLTYWIWAVEAGEVFKGSRKTGETITIQSYTKKNNPVYKLKVRYTASDTKKVLQEKEIQASFTHWFSENGTFHPEPFRAWLAREIDILAAAEKETLKKTGNASSHVSVDEGRGKKK